MSRVHPLLARQLARLAIDVHEVPSKVQWTSLLERVTRAYQEADQERYLLERSQDLASEETAELYRALEAEKAQLESRVDERTSRLRESETHLAEAQRIATLGSWSYVPQTRELNWSEECYRLLGLDSGLGPPALAQLIGIVHEDDRARVRDLLRDAFERGANGDFEFRIVQEGGGLLWLHALLETFTGKEGEVILLRGTLRDITRQKQAEDERDFAIARLNTALFGSNLILVDVDPSGVVYLSERWNVLLGGEPKDTHTTFDALMTLTHEDEREAILREYVDVLSGRKPDYNLEHRVRANDGTWRWIRSRGRVVERDGHGRAHRLAGINEDITARKESEERLRQSESRFRSLLALSSDWYWEQDENLRFTEVAGMDPHRDRLGVAQFLGQTGFDQGQILGEADLARYRSLTAARQPFRDLTQTVRDSDGEWRFISFSGEPVFDRDGRFAGYRGIARDVTQSRRAEERIRRLAHFDELTGLPNRTMFMHTLQRAFSLAQRRGKQFALFFIDLDRFKNINDSLGHEAGDRLLQDVARTAAPSSARERHRRAPGRRRVRRARRGLRRPARAQRHRPEHPECGGAALHAVGPGVSRHRQHRHLDVPRGWSRPGGAAQERRHRDVPREGSRQEQLPVLLAAAERALVRAAGARVRVAARAGAAGVRAALPAEGRHPLGPHRRRGGAPALEPSRPRRWWRPTSSSRSRRRRASSCRSAAGCCAPRARSRPRGAAKACPACAWP